MVKVGWIGVGTYLLMDLEGCPTVKLPSVEYVCGGNGSKSLKTLGQQGDRSRLSPWVCLVLALAVSVSVEISGDVHASFHNGSRWGLLMRPVRRALHRSCNCGNRYGCFCWVCC